MTLTIHCVNGDIIIFKALDSGIGGLRDFLVKHDHEGSSITFENVGEVYNGDTAYEQIGELYLALPWSPLERSTK